jgi:hypothetical protein
MEDDYSDIDKIYLEVLAQSARKVARFDASNVETEVPYGELQRSSAWLAFRSVTRQETVAKTMRRQGWVMIGMTLAVLLLAAIQIVLLVRDNHVP